MGSLFSGRSGVRLFILILVEQALIVLSVLAAAELQRRIAADLSTTVPVARAVLVALVLQICLHYCDLYDFRTLVDRRTMFIRLTRALGAASMLLAFVYYWLPELVVGRGVIALAAFPIILLVAGWRLAFERLSVHKRFTERLLIVGTGSEAVVLAREIYERRHDVGVELIGFVDPDPERVGAPVINPGVIGTIQDIPGLVQQHRIDHVVLSLADARGKLNMNQLLDIKLNQGVRFDDLVSVYERYTGKIAVANLRPSWMIFSEGFRQGLWASPLKRAFDICLALTGLTIAAPVMLIVAVAMRFASPGPILYTQQRVGKDGVPFTIFKFRSMQVDAEAGTGAVWSRAGDARVTPIGRYLRRTRLDELPQLWNVLRGDMSFVGPRPERPEFVADLTRDIPFYGRRHCIRPGLTGWAQIRHPYGSTVDDALQKLQYELYYIKHISMAFDIFIVIETVKTILVKKGS